MKANRSPAFQFYAADWFDFRVQRMSFQSQGIYMKLLAFMWKDSADQCSVLDDDSAISRAIGATSKEWAVARAQIQWANDPILVCASGKLISKRLRKEADKQKQYKNMKSQAGKDGANKRWHNHRSAIDVPIAKHSSSSSSSSSINSPLSPPRGARRSAAKQKPKDLIGALRACGHRVRGEPRTIDAGMFRDICRAGYVSAVGDIDITGFVAQSPSFVVVKTSAGEKRIPLENLTLELIQIGGES